LPSASTSQHEIVTDPNASRPEDSNKIQGGSNMTGTDLCIFTEENVQKWSWAAREVPFTH